MADKDNGDSVTCNQNNSSEDNSQNSINSTNKKNRPHIESKTLNHLYDTKNLQVNQFKKLFVAQEYDGFRLNFSKYELIGIEDNFLLFKRNFNALTTNQQQANVSRSQSNQPTSKSIKYLQLNGITRTSTTKQIDEYQSEKNQIYLLHLYKNPTSLSLNEQYFYQQVTCYMKNSNYSLAYFQGFSVTDEDGKPFLTTLTKRPPNGSLLSLFSTIENNKKNHQPKNDKTNKGQLHSPSTINLNELFEITSEQKFSMIVGIVHGLAFIHKNNFIHSNLNPTTVYLNEKLESVICDYVFIPSFTVETIEEDNRNNDDDDDDDKKELKFKFSIEPSKAKEIFKDNIYVAPEIFEKGEIGPLSDIYSLGQLIFYILSEKNEKVSEENISCIPDEWKEIVLKCTSTDPLERPPAIQLINDLMVDKNLSKYVSSENTNLTLTIYKTNVNNGFENEKPKHDIFHKMIPNINEIDEDTKLLISAAEQDDIKSIEKVGDLFHTGQNNIYIDDVWSYELHEIASNGGSFYSTCQLARYNEEGIGTDIDLNKSIELYKKAIEMSIDSEEKMKIESKIKELYERKRTLILNVPLSISDFRIRRLFDKFKSINFEKTETTKQVTIVFETENDFLNAISKVKNQYKYETLYYKTIIPNRFDSLEKNNLKRIKLDDYEIKKRKDDDNEIKKRKDDDNEIINNPFEKEKLGEGNFATTYEVFNNKKKEYYAAKVFKNPIDIITKNQPEPLVNIFKREIIMASKFNHPAILKYIGFNEYSLYDFCLNNHLKNIKPTLIMKLIPNGDLKEAIENKKDQLNNTRKLIIIIGIASALSEMYKKQIIHRDLKPNNILLNENFEPIICDLGCSRQYSDDVKDKITGYVGSFYYMAPELFFDDFNPVYKYQVDSYSFGMIMYQILTLTIDVYKVGANNKLLMNKKLHEDPPKLPNEMNFVFKYIVESCWNISIDERLKPPTIYNLLVKAALEEENLLPDADMKVVRDYIKTLPPPEEE